MGVFCLLVELHWLVWALSLFCLSKLKLYYDDCFSVKCNLELHLKFQAWLLLHKLFSNNPFCLFFLETLMFVFCNVKQFYSIQLTGCEFFAMIINRVGQTVALRIWASKEPAGVKMYITSKKYMFILIPLFYFMRLF